MESEEVLNFHLPFLASWNIFMAHLENGLAISYDIVLEYWCPEIKACL